MYFFWFFPLTFLCKFSTTFESDGASQAWQAELANKKITSNNEIDKGFGLMNGNRESHDSEISINHSGTFDERAGCSKITGRAKFSLKNGLTSESNNILDDKSGCSKLHLEILENKKNDEIIKLLGKYKYDNHSKTSSKQIENFDVESMHGRPEVGSLASLNNIFEIEVGEIDAKSSKGTENSEKNWKKLNYFQIIPIPIFCTFAIVLLTFLVSQIFGLPIGDFWP